MEWEKYMKGIGEMAIGIGVAMLSNMFKVKYVSSIGTAVGVGLFGYGAYDIYRQNKYSSIPPEKISDDEFDKEVDGYILNVERGACLTGPCFKVHFVINNRTGKKAVIYAQLIGWKQVKDGWAEYKVDTKEIEIDEGSREYVLELPPRGGYLVINGHWRFYICYSNKYSTDECFVNNSKYMEFDI